MPSVYFPELTEEEKEITLSGEEYHHLSHVFRAKEGDATRIINGKGILSQGLIISIKKNSAKIKILSSIKKNKSFPYVGLAFSLLKNKNDSLIVEKATEIGVKDFFPYIAERTIKKANEKTVEKFRRIGIAASKQCDNAILPEIHSTSDLKVLIKKIVKTDYEPVLAYENEKDILLSDVLENPLRKPICLIIGPEGGFSEEEIILFRESSVKIVSLGNHILRAETAAIYGISQITSLLLTQNRDHY